MTPTSAARRERQLNAYIGSDGYIPDSGNGFGFVVVEFADIEASDTFPRGVALVNAAGDVIDFVGYGNGNFALVGEDGVVAGLTAVAIGRPHSRADGTSLQLVGVGYRPKENEEELPNFGWIGSRMQSPGTRRHTRVFAGSHRLRETNDNEKQRL